MRRFLNTTALVTTVFFAVACGPVTASRDLRSAGDEVESARETSAPYEAVYEFALADEYLQKAREEWAYSNWQKAERYAELAREYAADAVDRIGGGEGRAGRLLREAEQADDSSTPTSSSVSEER